MRRTIPIAVSFLTLIWCCAAAMAQPDPKQAICQANWERCLGNVQGKNWKPVYDRCLKARTVCLGGRAFTPESSPSPVGASILSPGSDASLDPANADPASRTARCHDGQPRGDRDSCILANATQGYGQNFSLLGPGVPLDRMQRASSMVKCAGGESAMFYANGRIQSCTLDNDGGLPLTDTSGKVVNCAARAVTRFDPEGRLLSCGPN
jgi:hypothetical protein